MPPVTDNGGRYEVCCAATIAKTIKRLQGRANKQGRGKRFLQALRTIGRRLTYEPSELGEALYQLPALRMQVRHVVVAPLIVYFGVCEDRSLVFIKRVDLLNE